MTFQTRRISEERVPRKTIVSAATPSVLRAGRFWTGWYAAWKKRRQEEQRSHKLFQRLALIMIALLLGVGLIGGAVKALIALRILTPRSILSVAGSDLRTDKDGFTNFLLLGVGDKDHDGIDLTDSMIVASIDPKSTHSIVMLSLPRDLYLTRSNHMGQGRINSMYRDYKWQLRREKQLSDADASKEALQELGDELGRQLGMEIHYEVKVDFTAFTKAVDALGGVDLEVPKDIVDPEYPLREGVVGTFSLQAGPQHLDGETALKYARSRHSTSDFDRSQRQQELLRALAEKAKAEGIASSPGRIAAFLKIFSEHVETTMSFGELLGVGKLAEDLDQKNLISMHLNVGYGYDTGLAEPGGLLYNPPRADFGGASVLLPVSIPPFPVNWNQLRVLTTLLLHNRAIYLSHPQIYILNAGAKSGRAGKLGSELTRFGFPVAEMINAADDKKSPLNTRDTSVVAARAEPDRNVALFFSSLLGIPDGALPADLPQERIGRITIMLGKDYTYKPLQDLVPFAKEEAVPSGSGSLSPLSSVSSDSSESSDSSL